MFRRRESQEEGSDWIKYIAAGIHDEEGGNILRDKEAWKIAGKAITVMMVVAVVYWGAVNVASCVVVSERLTRTPTPVLQKMEMKPTPEEVLGRGSQRWKVE